MATAIVDLDALSIPFDLSSKSWLISGKNRGGVRRRILSSMDSIGGAWYSEEWLLLLSPTTGVACGDPISTLGTVTLGSGIGDNDDIRDIGACGTEELLLLLCSDEGGGDRSTVSS